MTDDLTPPHWNAIDETADDPCDEWQVFIWNGELCKLVCYDSGVSPLPDDPYSVSWRYEVVETTFIPYGVFRCRKAVPL